jgi:hypothetical protein
VIDKSSNEVALRPVTVDDYDADKVVVTSGLEKGDVVVTAGVQKLAAGQKVRIATGGS